MTTQQALLSAIQKLQQAKSTSPHLDAEVLLAFVLKKSKEFLLTHPDKKISTAQQKRFNALITRRKKDIPIAYLIGQKDFYGLSFFVDKNVLVPRPDTELLVEETIKHIRQTQRTTSDVPQTICDIGTGSGCIAVTLAKYLPHCKIIASDISETALRVAQQNAKQYRVLKKIKFIHGDLLRPLVLKKIHCDIIVANLPYLTYPELSGVRHEPKTALYGGKMGVELIERLLIQSDAVLNPGGTILLEIAPTQTKLVDFIVAQQLPGKQISILKDLTGRDRTIKIF